MLNAFAAALDADLAVSPMIVVGGTDDAYPWVDPILDLARAGGMDAAYYRPVDTDDVQDIVDWASTREEGYDDVRCIVINVQGLGTGTMADDALRGIRAEGQGEHVVVLVVDADQLPEAREDIRTELGVEAALVPVTWQGVYPDVQEIGIVGSATLVGKQNGRFFVAANVQSPYPHEVHIDIDMGDRDDDAAMDELAGLGPDCEFAVLATLRDGRIVARFDDIVRM
jgi:hypothetical protein